MSSKEEILKIGIFTLKTLNIILDILDPNVKAVPKSRYQEIRELAQEILKKSEELP